MLLLEWNMYYLRNVFDVARHLIYLGILANGKKKIISNFFGVLNKA